MRTIRALRSVVVVLALALVAAVTLQPVAAAQAAVLEDAVTNVTINQSSVVNGSSSMTVKVDFSVEAGIGQGGTVRTGDEFWVDFDPQLSPLPGTFPVYATGTSTVVANVTVATSPVNSQAMRATFVLTNYVEPRTSTTGWAQWNINFKNNSMPPGETEIQFTTIDNVFTDTVVVETAYQPGTYRPYTSLQKAAAWENAGQSEFSWGIFAGTGPADSIVVDDVAPTDAFNSALWEFDCSQISAQFASTITGVYESEPLGEGSTCTPQQVHLILNDVTANTVAYFEVFATVTDTRPAGALTFRNQATVTKTVSGTEIVDKTPTSQISQTFSAGATGPTIPTSPKITQALCTGPGTSSQPIVSNADNSNGVSYETVGTVSAGQTIRVVATLEDGFTWDTGNMPTGWVISGNTASYSITLSEPDCSVPTQPVDPTITQVNCVAPGQQGGRAGVLPAANGNGVTYTVQGNPAPGATLTVTATLEAGRVWSDPLPTGWALGNTAGVAVYTVTFTNPDCVETTAPVTPDVTQATCTAPGQATEPTITLPTNGNGITYTQSGTVAQGSTVTITATLATGYTWDPTTMPTGWTTTTATEATYDVTLTTVNCVETTTPVTPQVSQARCIAIGETASPTLDLPQNRDGITYVIQGDVEQGQTVVVVASLADGYDWDLTDLPLGWSVDAANNNAEYEVTFTNIDCDGHATLLAPHAVQAVCTAPGVATLPVVTLSDHQDGISYTMSPTNPVAGQTVTVTATLTADYDWDTPLTAGWVLDPANERVAHYTVQLVAPDCIVTTTPLAPAVTEAVCLAPGESRAPKVELPANGDGVTYTRSGQVVPGGTVQVIATLGSGYAWDTDLGAGWVTENTTSPAVFTVTLADIDCIVPISPITPQVTAAECDATPGSVIDPLVILAADRAGVNYTLSGEELPGQTVTVVATLDSGYRWATPTALPAGWVFEALSGQLKYEITFPEIDCDFYTTPVAPDITQAGCSAPGQSTPASFEIPAAGGGITYRSLGVAEPGKSVTVIASLETGFAWNELPVGWVLNTDENTAEFTVEFDTVDCIVDVTKPPTLPPGSIVQPVCTVPGVIVAPSITLPTGKHTGVTYSQAGSFTPGGTVTVIASLEPEYRWAVEPNSGWEAVGDTYELRTTFEQVKCAGMLLSQTGLATMGIGLGLMIPALLTAAGIAFALRRKHANADTFTINQ